MHLFPKVRLGSGAAALFVAIAAALGLGVSAFATGSSAGGVNTPQARVGAVPAATTCNGTHVWAVVNADGTLARHSAACAATTSSLLSTGAYQVIFPRTITHCAFVATVGFATFSGDPAPGYAAEAGRAGTTNGVFIETFNASGTLTSQGFHLIVDC